MSTRETTSEAYQRIEGEAHRLAERAFTINGVNDSNELADMIVDLAFREYLASARAEDTAEKGE